MTPRRHHPNRRLQQLTLALTVVLAVALGGITSLSLTSLPYLATSPTTDPTFGPLNACLLGGVPERLGFAVSRDAKRVAAWSSSTLVECAGTPPVAKAFARAGVTLGTYDGAGALWVTTRGGDGGGATLARLEGEGFVERGVLEAAALAGTRQGVVVLEATGELLAVGAAGEVSATRALPSSRGVVLQASADGSLVSLVSGGRFSVIDAVTLASTPAEVPCPVRTTWWRPQGAQVVVECLDLVIEVNAHDSQSQLLQPRRRVESTLVGPGGPYVQACDGLPCTVEAPR